MGGLDFGSTSISFWSIRFRRSSSSSEDDSLSIDLIAPEETVKACQTVVQSSLFNFERVDFGLSVCLW